MQILMVREIRTFNHTNFNCRFSMRLNNKSLNFMYSEKLRFISLTMLNGKYQQPGSSVLDLSRAF
jgi:hypothetical protein